MLSKSWEIAADFYPRQEEKFSIYGDFQHPPITGGVVARRRKSILDDLLDISSRLPWYISLLLAVGSSVVLHLIAGIEIQKPTNAAGLGSFAGKPYF